MVRKIGYWIATVLIALGYLTGAYFDIVQPEDMMAEAHKLGYPRFFFSILGVWKLGAGIVILVPRLPRLKEWAYAGIVINTTGAAATHIYMKDAIGDIVTPLVLLAIAMASWALRPASRKLAGPWV